MENTRIREYNKTDYSTIVELLTLNTPRFFALSEISEFETYLAYNIEKYFVLEVENQIVAAGGINYHDSTARISWDVVHPAFQNKGIGQKLLNYRLDLLKSEANIDLIQVRTSQLTYKFYQKNGFVLSQIVKDFWAEGFDLYDMFYSKNSADQRENT